MNGYRISEVYPTIQGEGFYAGRPMTILRLQGCGVGCTWCDTKHSWPETGELHDAQAVVKKVQEVCGSIRTVLVTGGEPAEQNLLGLALALKTAGFKLHLETSGTATGHISSLQLWEWITVSPKVDMPGGKAIAQDAIWSANELKFVIGKQEHLDEMELFLAKYLGSAKAEQLFAGRIDSPVVSVQPLSANEKATKLCVEAAMQRGVRLSVQQHKALGLP